MADKRVERVTAVEANLTSPSISLDIITETVAVGTPIRVAATSVEKGSTPVIWSKTTPMKGRKKSLRSEEEKSLQDHLIDLSGQSALRYLKMAGVAIMDIDGELYAYVSKPTVRQQQIFRSLKIKAPPRFIMDRGMNY